MEQETLNQIASLESQQAQVKQTIDAKEVEVEQALTVVAEAGENVTQEQRRDVQKLRADVKNLWVQHDSIGKKIHLLKKQNQ